MILKAMPCPILQVKQLGKIINIVIGYPLDLFGIFVRGRIVNSANLHIGTCCGLIRCIKNLRQINNFLSAVYAMQMISSALYVKSTYFLIHIFFLFHFIFLICLTYLCNLSWLQRYLTILIPQPQKR